MYTHMLEVRAIETGTFISLFLFNSQNSWVFQLDEQLLPVWTICLKRIVKWLRRLKYYV